MQTTEVIIKPIVTEHSMSTVADGTYSFVVAKAANKLEIKKAIETKFGVTVVSVATSIVKGKTKRVGTRRQEVKAAPWKKAMVTVKKGEKIALFEPAADEKKKK